MQGIFVTAQPDTPRLRAIRITDNLLVGTAWNGVTVQGADDVSITGNRLISPPPNKERRETWIRLADASDFDLSGNAVVKYVLQDNRRPRRNEAHVVRIDFADAERAIQEWDARR